MNWGAHGMFRAVKLLRVRAISFNRVDLLPRNWVFTAARGFLSGRGELGLLSSLRVRLHCGGLSLHSRHTGFSSC